MNISDVLASVDWWNLLLALCAVTAALIFARLARKGVRALMRKASGITETVATIASRFVGYTILLLGFGIGLALLGANIQPLLAIVLVLAVVVVLVLRGVADNFAAGVLLQTRQAVKLGDEIVFDGVDGALSGVVTEMNARSVVVLTVDGRVVHVPNARLLSDPLINDSAHGARRGEVQVRVELHDVGVHDVLPVLEAAARSTEGVHHREPVHAFAASVSGERVVVQLQFWHHPLHQAAVTSAVVLAVSDAVRDRGWHATVTSVPGVPPLVPPDVV